MALFEMGVSKKSFWAKYEGSNTCNAKAVYVLIALAALAGVGLVALFIWGLFVELAATLALATAIVLLCCFMTLMIVSDLKGRDYAAEFFSKPMVKNFFKYGFIWLWWPIRTLFRLLCLAIGKMVGSQGGQAVGAFIRKSTKVCIVRPWKALVVPAWKATLGRVFAYLSDLSAKREAKIKERERARRSNDAYWKAKDIRQAWKAENEKIREDFWKTCWRDFLTHTSIMGLLLGSFWMYVQVPGPRTLWGFPFMFALCCMVSWLAFGALFAGIVTWFIPSWERYSRQHPAGQSFLVTLYSGGAGIWGDIKKKVCRLIVVTDYQAWSLPMRRVFSTEEAQRQMENTKYRLILFGKAVSHCEKGAWELLVRPDDEETIRLVKEKVEKLSGWKGQSDSGYLCFKIIDQTFLQLYPKLQAASVASGMAGVA